MTYREAYDKGRKSIESDEADIECAILLEYVMNTQRGDLFSHPDRILSDEEEKTFFSLIERRKAESPFNILPAGPSFTVLSFFATNRFLFRDSIRKCSLKK